MWSRLPYGALIVVVLLSALGGSCLACTPTSCIHGMASSTPSVETAETAAPQPSATQDAAAQDTATQAASSHCAQMAAQAERPAPAPALSTETAPPETQETAGCCNDASSPAAGCAGITAFSVSIDQATLIASTTAQQAPSLVEAFSIGWELLVERPPLYLHQARPPDPPRSLHTLHSVFLI